MEYKSTNSWDTICEPPCFSAPCWAGAACFLHASFSSTQRAAASCCRLRWVLLLKQQSLKHGFYRTFRRESKLAGKKCKCIRLHLVLRSATKRNIDFLQIKKTSSCYQFHRFLRCFAFVLHLIKDDSLALPPVQVGFESFYLLKA